jgi:hypothetical protein
MKLVAFLDILGFSDLVQNNTFEELSSIYKIFERSFQHGVTLNQFTQKPNVRLPDFSNCYIEAIQISDSIILWAKDESIISYYDLILIVRELLGHGMFSGLPLRACIDHGEFGQSIKNYSEGISTNTFFGKVITTSKKKCESQSWSGGFLTQQAVEAYSKVCSSESDEYIRTLTNIDALEKRNFIKKFKVSFLKKESGEVYTSEEYCINWVNWQNPKKSLDNLLKSFGKHNKGTSKDRTQTIIRNTVEFWNSCPIRLK